MDLLKEAHKWIQKGYEISYLVIDQIENGYESEVKDGSMPRYTYTFSVNEGFENEVWCHSVDSLEIGYEMAIKWLKKERKH